MIASSTTVFKVRLAVIKPLWACVTAFYSHQSGNSWSFMHLEIGLYLLYS